MLDIGAEGNTVSVLSTDLVSDKSLLLLVVFNFEVFEEFDTADDWS